MKAGCRLLTLIGLVVLLITGCGPAAAPPATRTPVPTPTASVPAPSAIVEPLLESGAGLSAEQVATLSGLERLDDYPLYTMHYRGAYGRAGAELERAPERVWACSLFAALGDPRNMLYGRNFDWDPSPALLLFTDPPDGYASVSMVDIAFLGLAGDRARALDELPIAERVALLDAPWLPFDGMNEYGLVVGMAAVPPGNVARDPQKPTIGSVGIIREMLDHARTVDEALALLEEYNVDMAGGPPIHYLIADRSGRALLLEFYNGALRVLPNKAPWHQATNFLRAAVPGDAEGWCWRYDELSRCLDEAGGRLSVPQALDLLSAVSQSNTQWSVVYGLQSGRIDVVMGRNYAEIRTLQIEMAPLPGAGME